MIKNISKDEYNNLALNTRKEARNILGSYGFFDLVEEEKNIPRFEEIFWNIAKKYGLGEITSSVFDEVCLHYNGGYVFYKLSYEAQSIITFGIELDYYKYIQPDENEFKLINNGIKRNLKAYFGSEIDSLFKI